MDKLYKIYIKHVTYFEAVIKARYPASSVSLMAKMKTEYDLLASDMRFAVDSKDRRIPVCGMFLSFIRVLNGVGENYESIRSACLDVATDFVTPKNSFQKNLKLLQGRLVKSWLFRLIVRQLKKRVKNKAHEDGFAVDIITDPKETFGLGYGIDIIECGICKLFVKRSSGHYTKTILHPV